MTSKSGERVEINENIQLILDNILHSYSREEEYSIDKVGVNIFKCYISFQSNDYDLNEMFIRIETDDEKYTSFYRVSFNDEKVYVSVHPDKDSRVLQIVRDIKIKQLENGCASI